MLSEGRRRGHALVYIVLRMYGCEVAAAVGMAVSGAVRGSVLSNTWRRGEALVCSVLLWFLYGCGGCTAVYGSCGYVCVGSGL